MKTARLLLCVRIGICYALIRASGAAYDAVTGIAHAAIRAAGRFNERLDARLYQRWVQLKTARDMLAEPATEPAAPMGDRVLRAVMLVVSGIVAALWVADMNRAYADVIVAMWSGQ